MHKRYPKHNITLPVSPPLGFYASVLFLAVAIHWTILSVGAINALIPIMIIVILIAAAAGSTRNFSFFNIFGISQMLSGLGSYGGGSRGSMAKSGYSMRAYLDPFIRYVAKKRDKGGKGDFEKTRKDSLKGILLEAKGIRGSNKGGPSPGQSGKGATPSGPGGKGGPSQSYSPKANILMSQTGFGAFGSTIKGTATKLRLMKGPAPAQSSTQGPSTANPAKNSKENKPEINISPIGMSKFIAPFRWGLAKSIQDQYGAYRPRISKSETSEAPPRPVKEQMALRTLLYGENDRKIKTRQESIDEKKIQLKKMEDEYSKKYKTSDIAMVFTPALGDIIDPLRLVSSNQRQNSREAWKSRNEIQKLRAQIWIEENEVNKGKTDNLYTGHIEDALQQLKAEEETCQSELKHIKKLYHPNKYREVEARVKKINDLMAQGKNLLSIAPLMSDSVRKRLDLIEQYTGNPAAPGPDAAPDVARDTESATSGITSDMKDRYDKGETASKQPGRPHTRAATPGIISDLKDKYDKGEITDRQFDMSYVRIYNNLYGPIDKSIMHHITNRFYSNYLLGISRTSDKPSGYAELVDNFLKLTPKALRSPAEDITRE